MKRSSPLRKAAILPESIHRQLNMYALAASAAGVGGLALAQPAEAKIVYTPAHVAIHKNHPLPIDLNHDGIKDFVLNQMSTHTTSYNFSSLALITEEKKLEANKVIGGEKTGASALAAGVEVSGGKSFQYGVVPMAAFRCTYSFKNCKFIGPWAGGGKGVKNRYLGLKFFIKGSVHYGWARLNVAQNHNGSPKATLTGYAYETVANKSIITGKTRGPDAATVRPATLGRLAAGASANPAGRRSE